MSRFGDKQLREAEPDFKDAGTGIRLGDNDAQRRQALRYLFNKPSRIDDVAFCRELGSRPISSTSLRRDR